MFERDVIQSKGLPQRRWSDVDRLPGRRALPVLPRDVGLAARRRRGDGGRRALRCRACSVDARPSHVHNRRAGGGVGGALGVRGAGDPHRRSARRPDLRPPRRRGVDHLALVVHPGRVPAGHEHLAPQPWCWSHEHAADHLRRRPLLLRGRLPRDDDARGLPRGCRGHGPRATSRFSPTPTSRGTRTRIRRGSTAGTRGSTRFGLRPTCYSCWLDTRLHRDRGLTAEEAAAILERDVRLAHRLGFTIVRPKLGVVSLDLLPDPVWREATRRVLPTAVELGVRIAPEIHAPTPLRSRSSTTTSRSPSRKGRATSAC